VTTSQSLLDYAGEGDTKVVAEFAGPSSRYIEKPERVEDANEI